MEDLISLLLFMAIVHFLIVIHELAHAAVIFFYRINIQLIQFGFPRLLTLRLGGHSIGFGPLPIAGFVRYDTASTPWYQNLIIAGVGPLINIALGLVLFLLGSGLPQTLSTLSGLPAATAAIPQGLADNLNRDYPLFLVLGKLFYLLLLQDFPTFLSAVGSVSLVVGLGNFLPIPALDGGRILISLLSAHPGNKLRRVAAISITSTTILLFIYLGFELLRETHFLVR